MFLHNQCPAAESAPGETAAVATSCRPNAAPRTSCMQTLKRAMLRGQQRGAAPPGGLALVCRINCMQALAGLTGGNG